MHQQTLIDEERENLNIKKKERKKIKDE